MQKLIEIAEKYVEWVAIGIGGVFLLLMVVIYFIGTPVSAVVWTGANAKHVTLANVDDYIYQAVGSNLEAKIQGGKAPQMAKDSIDYAQKFEKFMSLKDLPPTKLAGGIWMGMGTPPSTFVHAGGTTQETHTGTAQVNKLPEPLPAAESQGASFGKSEISTQGPAAPGVGMAPVAPDAMAGNAMNPAASVVPGMAAGAPAVGAPGAGAAPAAPGVVDKLWVTQAFSISTTDIAALFKECNIPNNQPTSILMLQVVREEEMPDHTWGKSTMIKPLAMHNVPDFPNVGDRIAEGTYLEWTKKNWQTIEMPSFYPVLAGDVWYAPGQNNPNIAVEVKPVAPPPTTPKTKGTKATPTKPPTGYKSPRGGGAAPAPAPVTMEPPPGMPAGLTPGTPGVAKVIPAIPDGHKVPEGDFTPAELGGDIYIWIHDDTVEAGKTYHYKLVYLLKNPMYLQPGLVGNAALARQFALRSAESDWSAPVTLPVLTRFFVASGFSSANANVTKFDVFRWQNGKWHLKSFTVAPGDMIGLQDASSGINYETGWTLVDVKPNATSPRVIVADPEGNLMPRNYSGDQGDLQQFKKAISWAEPVTPPAGMVPPGR